MDIKELAEEIMNMGGVYADDIEYDDGVAYAKDVAFTVEALDFVEDKVRDEDYDSCLEQIRDFILEEYARELGQKYQEDLAEANELQSFYDRNR